MKKMKIVLCALIPALILAACTTRIKSKTVSPEPKINSIINIEVTGISASSEEITITWTDPIKSGLDHIDIVCSNGADLDIAEGVNTQTFAASPSKDFTIRFICIFTDGTDSKENLIYVSTPASGTVVHTPIATSAALDKAFNTDVGTGLSGFYFLTKDLNLSAYQSGTGWDPIGDYDHPFKGIFNGNGHTITGLVINDPASNDIGFFGRVDNGKISNMHIDNGNTNGHYYTGGLVGKAINYTEISNCSYSGSVTSSYSNVGGLVGDSIYSNIVNSYSTGSVNGNDNVGGLVGQNDSSTISNSYSAGSVTGSYHVGGLVGMNDHSIISNCYSTGTANGYRRVGGLVGNNNYKSKILNSYSTTSVTGTTNTGGLVGDNLNYSIISDCFSTGTVANSIEIAGGLVGDNSSNSQISNSFSTSSVTGSDYVGGLAGVNNYYSLISNSYSMGFVTGNGSVGGLIGSNGSTILNCFSTGSVTGNFSVGGLVGNNYYCIVSDSYSTGLVTGTTYVGGCIGRIYSSTLTSLYWDNTVNTGLADIGYNGTNSNVDDASITGLSTGQMKDLANVAANYSGWDFMTIWHIDGTTNNGYPFLR